jgi:steroid 5-alpha reductase family enzyme
MTAGVVVLLIALILLWIISLRIRDASIVDIFWGSGFLLLAATYWAEHTGSAARATTVLVLTGLWGLRLSAHIFRRNRGKAEDFRYAAWRQQHGTVWPLRSLFQVFLLQGSLMLAISMPLRAAMNRAAGWPDLFDGLGLVLWMIGVGFEVTADRQLKQFLRTRAAGDILDQGLWSLSRHPNYFGNALLWWGFFVMALPAGWWTLFSPLLMTLLLRFVSGVALLERHLSRRPEYQAYMERTPAFIPDFRRILNRIPTKD